MRVAIGGGTGLIGRKLVEKLASGGHEAVVLTRNPAHVKGPSVAWDPEHAPFPSAALGDVDAIVHLSGEGIAEKRWTDAQKKRIRDSRVVGTRAIAQAIRAAEVKPRVFICASAVGIYGDRGDDELTEESAPGSDFLAQVCREWEAAASDVEAAGVRRVSARFGVVLSSEGGALGKMLPVFRAGLGGRLGSGKQWFPWAHLDDVVGLLAHALTTDISGPLNVVSPEQVTNARFTALLGDALHRPTLMRVPGTALKLALGEMSTTLLGSQRVVPKKALAGGYTFKHPALGPALRDLVSR